jgi:methyl acetate hydrolase
LRKPIEAGLIRGVVALAANDRSVIYKGAFGRRAVGKFEPMALDSVLRIASMTKAVTDTAAMQLVEKGQIGLELPMDDLLARLREKTSITLRHLMPKQPGPCNFAKAIATAHYQCKECHLCKESHL